jgi:hypothetical protein
LHPKDKASTNCVYGFWGTRHQVEQLVSGVTARDSVVTLAPLRTGAVHLTVGLTDGTLGALPANLLVALSKRATDWLSVATESEDLLARLRDDETRPAILFVASHCELETDGGRKTPRIQLPGSDRWLRPRQIIEDTIDNARWREPHPLVMLAACGSGSPDLGSFGDFVAAFLDAGASGVVGTEAAISEGLAARAALFITPSMLDGATLGQVMLQFRRDLLRAGDPLGFLFTAFGPADLAAPADPALVQELA